ncbi:MAG: chorismate mutase [Rickettsiales bacterium]|jgi:chorismate mutase
MNNTTLPIDTKDSSEQELYKLRQKIDEIDEVIINKIIERTGIVKQVGELKQRTATVPCPIRPRREAEMIRSIIERFRPTDFPAGAAAAIWRIIIGASTSIEADLTLSVFSDDKENNLYWLAREYFGANSQIIKQPHIKRIIGDVMDGKAAVGIVPFLRSADTSNWWTVLLQRGENVPKIFAHVPFVYTDIPGKDIPSALAIAKLLPEPSGDDMSIIVIEADNNVSQSRLQTVFMNAKLEVTWINIANLNPTSRHHLVEIKGFITNEHEEFAAALLSIGRSIFGSYFLGAYATPMTLANSQNI